jgi:hypothetical protein
MPRESRRQRVILSILCISIGIIGCRKAGPPAALAPVDDPLQLVPADALFCLRIHPLEEALGKLDQYLMGVAPIMPGVIGRMQLGQMLGNDQLAGVRMDGDFILFGQATSSDSEDFTLAGLLPLTDAALFLEKSPQCQPTEDPAVRKLTAARLGPLYLVAEAEYALFCPDRRQLERLRRQTGELAQDTRGSLAEKIGTLPVEDREAPFWIHGNTPAVNRLYGSWLRDRLAEMKDQIGSALAQQSQTPGGPPANAEGATLGIEMISSMLNAGLTQLASLSLTLAPDAQTLRVSPTIQALPDTELAEALAGSSDTLDRRLLPFLEPKTTMSFWGQVRISTHKIWWEISREWMSAILSPQQVQTLQETAEQISDVFAGAGVASMEVHPDQRPWFSLRYALPIKGRASYETLMDRAQVLMNDLGLMDWYERQFGIGMQLTYQKDVARYQDQIIDAMTLVFTAKDPNNTIKTMVDQMYGEGFQYRFSATEDLMLMAVGPDVDTHIRAMIDQAQSLSGDPAAPPEFQAALDLVPRPEQAGFILAYNYVRILSAMPALVSGMPSIPAQSQSNLVIAGRARRGHGTLDVILPKQHLMEIVQYFVAMQMQIQQQQQQQQRQPVEAPAEPAPADGA